MFVLQLLGLSCLVSASFAYDAYADIGNEFVFINETDEANYEVPTGFLIGAGSAAYQTEGAWNVSGKGESIWDHFFHYNHTDLANGDVACDSYHNYKTDVLLVKNMKLNFYRISLSWPRLLPDGTTDNVNQDGVDFYTNFLNEMINNGITPVITLYHWDLPQALQEKGGWLDASIQDHYLEYATFAFKTFGHLVKWWTTFNEPHLFCSFGYESGIWAPGIVSPGVGLYQCAHNVILAHAKAYDAYYQNFSLQGGEVGITLDFGYSVPLNISSPEDQEAAERDMVFSYAWFADPIMFGDYPEVMRTAIDANSKAEGLSTSRLPTFTAEEKKLLQAATDFLGINHYFSSRATPAAYTCSCEPSSSRDKAVTSSRDADWSLGHSQKTPWGLRGCLNWARKRYYNFPTFVTENGYSGTTAEGLNDFNRISYLSGYMRGTLRALHEDNCNVLGYSFWSLIDNLEWTSGYGSRYGVGYTHYEDADLKRVPKKSATFMRQVMTNKRVQYVAFNDN